MYSFILRIIVKFLLIIKSFCRHIFPFIVDFQKFKLNLIKIEFQEFLDKLTMVVGGISPRIRQLLEVAQIRYLVDIGTLSTLETLFTVIESRMDTVQQGFRLPMDKVALSDIRRRLNLEGASRFLEAEDQPTWLRSNS